MCFTTGGADRAELQITGRLAVSGAELDLNARALNEDREGQVYEESQLALLPAKHVSAREAELNLERGILDHGREREVLVYVHACP